MRINHITFSVSDLDKSIRFYEQVLGAKLLVKGEKTAYFDLDGLWLALNVQKEIPRNEIHHSYTHIAFTVTDEEIPLWEEKLQKYGVPILEGRKRDDREKQSIYFTDPDGHKFEVHTGTREDRIQYYKDTKKDMEFYT
ncbi:metallothiol transferase FosB [Thermoflavimicrobium dichotomicum]|uniref:Metallothiol transferase FosB n=1 Tax=Thermoflavimicrobium dichotomicum TaxID=46223 RepID=A0A1I3LDS8_9BACL|nr:metallothiol transferase FosB [Thermoflavimicrobium dichotomicum]SFI82891.1 metallothiol transferase [Thermoflavimicrobium dichotomicum]